MLEQLQVTWDDVETNDDTLGLTDLSLEQFRQELFEMFQKDKALLKKYQTVFLPALKPYRINSILSYPRHHRSAWISGKT